MKIDITILYYLGTIVHLPMNTVLSACQWKVATKFQVAPELGIVHFLPEGLSEAVGEPQRRVTPLRATPPGWSPGILSPLHLQRRPKRSPPSSWTSTFLGSAAWNSKGYRVLLGQSHLTPVSFHRVTFKMCHTKTFSITLSSQYNRKSAGHQ